VGQYDILLTNLFQRKKVTQTQPVSPSVAIPLLRAAYDEGRPELQELLAALIAAAMDPKRSGRVRLSFIETLKRFDPLDALVLKARCDMRGVLQPSALGFIANTLEQAVDEVQASIENLKVLGCVEGAIPGFYINNYGKLLIKACSD
jgi:hypothetical protein